MVYDPNRLTAKHLRMVERMLDGVEVGELGVEMSMSPGEIRRIVRRPGFQHELARRRRERQRRSDEVHAERVLGAKRVLVRSVKDAAKKVRDLSRDARSESVQLAASVEILDRVMPDEKERRGGITLVIDPDLAGRLMEEMRMSIERENDLPPMIGVEAVGPSRESDEVEGRVVDVGVGA